jgi:hypothetical protein
VLPEEPVDVFVSNLGDSSIEMGLRVWVKKCRLLDYEVAFDRKYQKCI